MEQFGNILPIVGALLLVAAMLSTAIRRLRLLALVAGLLFLVHFLLVDRTWLAAGLALLFLLANGFRLIVLARRARDGKIIEDERELFDHVFGVQDPANQSRLRDLLAWKDVAAGAVLMEQGQPQPPLIYIAQGSARISHAGQDIGVCGAGDFLGEMSVVSGNVASATVIATKDMRIAEFNRDGLGELVRSVPEIGKALDVALNRSLAAKVLRMNQSASTQGAV